MFMDVVILNSGPKNYLPGKTLYRTLGAYKIAHSCRKEGFRVKVIDHVVYFQSSELITTLKKYITPDTLTLAISTTFLLTGNRKLIPNIAEAVAAIVSEFPNLKIIMGGYGTYAAKELLAFDTYAIVLEYGEDLFKEIMKNLRGQGPEPNYTIEFNTFSKKPIKVFSKPLVTTHNIETEDFKFHADDSIVEKETLPLEISRGCIFKCKFCNHLLLGRGKLDYLRSFELIKEELVHNYNNWGTTTYYVICDTFNDTEYKMREWHKMILSLPFKIKFTAYLRADLLDKFPDVPYMLKESGLVSAFHGIESLNRESALSVGKGWSGLKAKEYIPKLYHDIWNKEVYQTLSFIAGLPGDSKESLLDTVDWFNKNDLYHIFMTQLGLTNNKNIKNLSEFERDYKKYGYYFDNETTDSTDHGNWKNSYWSMTEVEKFIKQEINPRIHKPTMNSSWRILYYAGLGIDLDVFKNKSIYIPDSISNEYLEKYKKIL
jgi:radical SAM superfamily enzyme YgiQ (UPF0313 family)